MEKISFPAKILLFGEHTILRSSKALAIPFPQLNSYWSWKEKHEDVSLLAFADFLESTLPDAFDINEFKEEIRQGLLLYSSIPNGYGLGSSGTVCVAIFHRFATKKGHQLLQKNPKTFFGKMEAFFHGSSSGTDPLIIYVGQSLCLFTNGDYQLVELSPLAKGLQFFLLDTQQARKTAPLVERFTEQYDENQAFQKKVDTQWSKPTNEAIEGLLNSDMVQLWSSFEKISHFQFDHLKKWILPSLFPAWKKGLDSQDYLLKICGAGGGGYCLGLTKDWQKTKVKLSEFPLIPFDIN